MRKLPVQEQVCSRLFQLIPASEGGGQRGLPERGDEVMRGLSCGVCWRMSEWNSEWTSCSSQSLLECQGLFGVLQYQKAWVLWVFVTHGSYISFGGCQNGTVSVHTKRSGYLK